MVWGFGGGKAAPKIVCLLAVLRAKRATPPTNSADFLEGLQPSRPPAKMQSISESFGALHIDLACDPPIERMDHAADVERQWAIEGRACDYRDDRARHQAHVGQVAQPIGVLVAHARDTA